MNLFLDTETIPTSRSDVYAHFAAKHFDVVDVEKAAKKANDEIGKTSLSGLFGELVVMSFAVDDDDPILIVRDLTDPDGERAMLANFCRQMAPLKPSKIVAHNAEFDRSMIRQRGIVQGVVLPRAFSAVDVKPWDSQWVCTMALWTDDRRGRVSLDALCLALGVQGKGGMDGSKVAEMVRQGRIDEVATYCAQDVRCVRACYQRMTAHVA